MKICLYEDLIDIRDVIARVEELETARDNFTASNRDGHQTHIGADEVWAAANPEDSSELTELHAILSELKGYGGDEQWRGDWYPLQLIAKDYFIEYARDLVHDCGYIHKDTPLWIKIDWEETAQEMLADYSLIDIGKYTYFYHS